MLKIPVYILLKKDKNINLSQAHHDIYTDMFLQNCYFQMYLAK